MHVWVNSFGDIYRVNIKSLSTHKYDVTYVIVVLFRVWEIVPSPKFLTFWFNVHRVKHFLSGMPRLRSRVPNYLWFWRNIACMLGWHENSLEKWIRFKILSIYFNRLLFHIEMVISFFQWEDLTIFFKFHFYLFLAWTFFF